MGIEVAEDQVMAWYLLSICKCHHHHPHHIPWGRFQPRRVSGWRVFAGDSAVHMSPLGFSGGIQLNCYIRALWCEVTEDPHGHRLTVN